MTHPTAVLETEQKNCVRISKRPRISLHLILHSSRGPNLPSQVYASSGILPAFPNRFLACHSLYQEEERCGGSWTPPSSESEPESHTPEASPSDQFVDQSVSSLKTNLFKAAAAASSVLDTSTCLTAFDVFLLRQTCTSSRASKRVQMLEMVESPAL